MKTITCYRLPCPRSSGAITQPMRRWIWLTGPFVTAFPRGFALEVLEVYSGPPNIVYKFRHWGFMEGPFKGHAPTGEMVELYGVAVFKVTLLKCICHL